MGESYFPDKCKLLDLPPRDPLLYRLYEVVANFGYAYKSIIHEKFGDGIMSAIAFTSQIEKEMVGEDGESASLSNFYCADRAAWVKITLKGKFLPYKRW